MKKISKEDIYIRQILLVGKEKHEKIVNTKVAIFGVGGVGGYTFEALVRNGIENILICDKDVFDISNLNRQILATTKTIGMKKVEVAKQRGQEINPYVNIVAKEDIVNSENIEEVLGDFKPDYIVDAIDDIDAKVALIVYAKKNNIKIISSMGAGKRTWPEKLKTMDIFKTSKCPMAKKIRKALREENIKKVDVVFSEELPKKIPGTVVATVSEVPATAGLIAASYVLNDILGYEK